MLFRFYFQVKLQRFMTLKWLILWKGAFCKLKVILKRTILQNERGHFAIEGKGTFKETWRFIFQRALGMRLGRYQIRSCDDPAALYEIFLKPFNF